jgi:hypothetical protein
VLSDHGHVTVEKHFDLTAALEDSGFIYSPNLVDTSKSDFTLLWGYSGNIYIHNSSIIKDMVYELQAMDEMGMLFTSDYDGINGIVEGTFSKRLISGDHRRSGDIRFVLRSENKKDHFGKMGTCVCAAPLGIGCGIHGGLNDSEVHTLLGFGGSAFKKNTTIQSVTGVLDVTPTIYHLLGLTPLLPVQGSVVHQALINSNQSEPVTLQHRYSTKRENFNQTLSIQYKDRIPYLLHGGRE